MALQCTLLTFTSILNVRLNPWLEENNILADEQLGFRRNHSCLEHALLVYLIAENRQLHNKIHSFFFIDLKKTFDSVNRKLLWYKL